MAIFFIRLTEGDNSARSIAFECDHETVADATRAIHEQGYLSGYRCEWNWNRDGSERSIRKKTGLTLTLGRVSTIEEPFVHFTEPSNGR
jgi:hypothetical protein